MTTTVNSMLRDVTTKILGVLVWTIVSVVISFVFSSIAKQIDGLDGLLSSHESVVNTCVITPNAVEVTLADVGGLAKVKEEIVFSLLLPLRYPTIFFKSRGPFASSRGILLTGPPGCGKTMLMKAVAKACGCCFICPTLAMLQSKFFGETQKLLAAMFSIARKRAPCIVFIDEVDSVFRTRGEDDSGCDYALKTEFLSLMDGMRTRGDEGVIVVGATNNADALDPALKRRMPTVLKVELPTPSERKHIVSLVCRDEPDASKSAKAFAALDADQTDGFSGSDLAEVYKIACRHRLREIMSADSNVSITHFTARLSPLTVENWRAATESLKVFKAATSVKHCTSRSKLVDVLDALQTKAAA